MFVSIAYYGAFVKYEFSFGALENGGFMFYDNIYKICNEKGTTPTTVLKELGFSSGNVSKWKKGSVPNVDIAYQIAQHLGVSMDFSPFVTKLSQNQILHPAKPCIFFISQEFISSIFL